MKKLIIAAMIVGAAIVSQAATISWTMTNVKTSDGETANSNTAYMFAYIAGTQGAITELTVVKAIQDAVQGGSTAETWLGANANYSWAGSEGTYSDASKTLDPVADFGLTAGSTYTFFTVFTDENKDGDIETVAVSEALAGKKIPTNSNNVSLGYGTQATYTASDQWFAVNGPEPTSGLMLLLGMGALALRRRRA